MYKEWVMAFIMSYVVELKNKNNGPLKTDTNRLIPFLNYIIVSCIVKLPMVAQSLAGLMVLLRALFSRRYLLEKNSMLSMRA